MIVDFNNFEWLDAIEKYYRITDMDVAEALGLNYDSVRKWRRKRSILAKNVQKICDKYGYQICIGGKPITVSEAADFIISVLNERKMSINKFQRDMGFSDAYFNSARKHSRMSPLTLQYVCDELELPIEMVKV